MTMKDQIERFAAGAGTPARAIIGLNADELRAFPVPGTWSIQQIIVHLLESDLVATHRMRRIVAEEKPLLIAYDETAFVRELDYHADDAKQAADLFKLNREFTAAWLRRLPLSAADRVGVHNQNGIVSLARMIEMYVNHVDHHMTFLRAKREKLGKPLGW